MIKFQKTEQIILCMKYISEYDFLLSPIVPMFIILLLQSAERAHGLEEK